MDSLIVREVAPGVSFTRFGVSFGGNVEYHDLEHALYVALGLQEMSKWVIGDILLHGEEVLGESYAQLVDFTHMSKGTVYNTRSVCKKVTGEAREVARTFSHAAVVASMKDKEEQLHWLKRSVSEDWSRDELRQAIKGQSLDAGGQIIISPLVPITRDEARETISDMLEYIQDDALLERARKLLDALGEYWKETNE